MGANGSSSTSSAISTSSSTSDPGPARPASRPGAADRAAGLVRLTHPFPSLLDGAVVAVLAVLAGAPVGEGLRLGLAMTGLQVSIGALNDILDAPADAGQKPGKPIPAGLVRVRAAWIVVLAGASLGLALSAPSGGPTVAVATLVLAIGFAYDLRFKGTPWSFLPFAIGIPLLPVYAWLGATGELPAWFAILVPCGVLAGAALAIANALADLERDRASGVGSVAVHLGAVPAWTLQVVLHGLVVGLALTTLAAARGAGPALLVVGLAGTALLGGAIIARSPSPRTRERAWQLQALGTAALAAGWVLGIHGA